MYLTSLQLICVVQYAYVCFARSVSGNKRISVQWACAILSWHDDVIKWKHFPRYRPFVWGIHWSPVDSPHKGQWGRALMLSLICAWPNGWTNNRDASDFRRHSTNYDVTVIGIFCILKHLVVNKSPFKFNGYRVILTRSWDLAPFLLGALL